MRICHCHSRAACCAPASLQDITQGGLSAVRCSQAVLFKGAVAVVIVCCVLYTHVRLHWLSGRSVASSPGCKSAAAAGLLDSNLLSGIQHLRYQQQILQWEQDAMLDTVWSLVSPGPSSCIPPICGTDLVPQQRAWCLSNLFVFPALRCLQVLNASD